MQKREEEVRQSWAATGCSVALDGWNSSGGCSLLNVLVDCPMGPAYLQSLDISAVEADVNALEFILDGVINHIGAQNIVQIISYTTSETMDAVGRSLTQKYKSLFWTVSASHCISLMLERIGSMDSVKETSEKAKMVTRLLYSNSSVLELLRQHTGGGSGLVKTSKVKAANPYLTLENMLIQKNNIENMLSSSGWANSTWASTDEAGKVANLVGDDSFCNDVDVIVSATVTLVKALPLIILGSLPHVYLLNPIFYYEKDFHSDSEVIDGLVPTIDRMANDTRTRQLISQQLDMNCIQVGDFEIGAHIHARNMLAPVHLQFDRGHVNVTCKRDRKANRRKNVGTPTRWVTIFRRLRSWRAYTEGTKEEASELAERNRPSTNRGEMTEKMTPRKLSSTVIDGISERLSTMDNLYFPRAILPNATNPSQRKDIILDLLSRDVAVFLERYGPKLTTEELQEFDVLKYDYEINWHLKHLQSVISPTSEQLKSRSLIVKNRRRAFMSRLISEGQYFSEDAMREREPYLHHEYVGKFQDPSGRSMARPGERWSETLLRQAEEDILVAKIRGEQRRLGVDEREWVGNERLTMEEEEEEEEEEQEEEEEEEEDEKADGQANGVACSSKVPSEDNDLVADGAHLARPASAEWQTLSATEMQDQMDQFTHLMQQKFLSGEDHDHVDYSKIDEDETLDDHWIKEANYDAEEKYFAED
ncbi:hypothetical protein Nepgr_028582 [Nepenthes gracilis]|uniref:DUF659 domain-containing protein n=1 Tax=Nepenthes gracilis TaxID=150966 RepID=A0AAD3TCJ3_NEPGR|nr:hypothetical protein Nepgr_028582 [Nepenthes gracilis]